MAENETPLEMCERHLAEAEVGVARHTRDLESLRLKLMEGPIMQKLLVMGTLTISLTCFGTCWAQSTASPPQIQPPAKTAPAKASHSSRSSVQQFKTEADAKSHCGADQVVWGNTSSHVLHDAGTKYYGKTAHGAYMCKGIAVNAGYHEAKE
jgi:hypothetical protein